VSEAQEAQQLRDENARRRKLAVDLSLDKKMLQESKQNEIPEVLRHFVVSVAWRSQFPTTPTPSPASSMRSHTTTCGDTRPT